MIIKSHGICTGTAGRVLAYVMAMGSNESVDVIDGDPESLRDADLFAGMSGHKNGVLHITISPDQEICLDELGRVVKAINDEFCFDPDDPALLVRHVSRRRNGAVLSHFHLIKPAADADGRVYDVYRSKKKDETVSRFVEVELGHDLTPGKHNDFVHELFMERGLCEHAEQIEHLLNNNAQADFSSRQHQKSRRLGFDQSKLVVGLKEIVALPFEGQPTALANLLSVQGNLVIEQGARRSRLLVKMGDHVVCNANRILKIPGPLVADFIEKTKTEIENEKPYPRSKGGECQEPVSSGCSRAVDGTARAAQSNDTALIGRGGSGRGASGSKSLGNRHSQSAGNHSRQSCNQRQHRRDGTTLRRPKDSLILAQMFEATKRAKPMVDDLKSLARDYNATSAEPSPDLDDPYLMMKLSQILAKSMSARPGV